MKKILILANKDTGLYKFRKELIQKLLEEGNKIYISLPYGKLVEPLKEMGCEFIDTPVDRRGVNPITDFRLLLEYMKIVKRIEPDLIITYTIKPNIYGGLISRLKKVPYIVNITGLGSAFQGDGILKKVIVILYKMALGKVKIVFFENEGNKQVFVDNHIIKEETSVVMHGAGVNLEEYLFTPMPEGNPIRFLFIGRVMKEKGIDELFEVAQRIKQKYENVEFDIVGPFEDDYEKLVQKLQENGILNYYGYQEDIKPFIAKCHCFVLPSYHEGMANTLLEAAAMGRPLITSNIHGCKEAVDENKNGYLGNIKNCNQIIENIEKFIKTDKIQKEKMGEESRKIMEEFFDKKIIVNKTMLYIKEILDR